MALLKHCRGVHPVDKICVPDLHTISHRTPISNQSPLPPIRPLHTHLWISIVNNINSAQMVFNRGCHSFWSANHHKIAVWYGPGDTAGESPLHGDNNFRWSGNWPVRSTRFEFQFMWNSIGIKIMLNWWRKVKGCLEWYILYHTHILYYMPIYRVYCVLKCGVYRMRAANGECEPYVAILLFILWNE